jgi:NAD(P)H dehydrogenase (quinone)
MSSFPHSSPGERIAITGPTGRVGGRLTELLAAEGADVVALTRRPDEVRLPAGVSIAAVDFGQPATLKAALQGADRLFVSHGTSPQQLENEIALIDAAALAGVRHIVKLSALGPATRLVPFSWHMQIEAHLAKQSMASTVLRPSAFADMLRRAAPQVAAGFWAGAAGDGRANFIDTRDVADAARIALREDVSPQSQRAYHLTGPRAWTMRHVAEALSDLLGRPVTYADRSFEEQRAALAASGQSPFVIDLLVGMDQAFRNLAVAETTLTVQELTGKAPRPLEAWLAENVDAFRE